MLDAHHTRFTRSAGNSLGNALLGSMAREVGAEGLGFVAGASFTAFDALFWRRGLYAEAQNGKNGTRSISSVEDLSFTSQHS